MTWLNPLAFVGLLTLAVPILVHLFGRRRARRQRFPSLRLLPLSTPNPAPSRQPSDLVLLAVRCGVVVAAVLALAQPRWSTPERARSDAVPLRVIVIDTSASLRRLTSSGRPALEEAREAASALADSSRGALVVETPHPGRELGGAGAWLATRPGVREVVVLSDFQAGALAEGDLASVPGEVGVRLRRFSTAGASADSATWRGVSLTARQDGIEATWPARSGVLPAMPRILAPAGDRAAVDAALAAARDRSGPEGAVRPVVIVFPGAPDREALLAEVAPPDSSWEGSLLVTLSRDPVLAAIAARAAAGPCGSSGVPLARGGDGAPIAIAAGAHRRTGELVLVSCVPVGTLAGAALVARVAAAAGDVPPPVEREPVALPDELLRQWERGGTVGATGRAGVESGDGRWLWLVALLLLGLEQWWRQRPARGNGPSLEGSDARPA